jgi:hypothetical protein
MSFNQFSEARTLWGGGVSVMLYMHDDCIGLICFSDENKAEGKTLSRPSHGVVL